MGVFYEGIESKSLHSNVVFLFALALKSLNFSVCISIDIDLTINFHIELKIDIIPMYLGGPGSILIISRSFSSPLHQSQAVCLKLNTN